MSEFFQGRQPDNHKNLEKKKPFKEAENGLGFETENGEERIYIKKEKDDIYRLSRHFIASDIYHYLTMHPDSILLKGSFKKEEMMQALKEMLEESRNKVIPKKAI